MSNDVRTLTELEARDQLVATAVSIANEYAYDPDLDAMEKCHGVAFSVLAALDGKRDIPAVQLIAQTGDDVVKVSKEQGEPYIAFGTNMNPAYDLHTRYAGMRQETAAEAVDAAVADDITADSFDGKDLEADIPF